jgi:hypothetical protein
MGIYRMVALLVQLPLAITMISSYTQVPHKLSTMVPRALLPLGIWSSSSTLLTTHPRHGTIDSRSSTLRVYLVLSNTPTFKHQTLVLRPRSVLKVSSQRALLLLLLDSNGCDRMHRFVKWDHEHVRGKRGEFSSNGIIDHQHSNADPYIQHEHQHED